MRRLLLAALAATCLITSASAYAQSNTPGPLATLSGELEFTRVERDFIATLDRQAFDRFGASTLTHFDDTDNAHDVIARSLVQTDAGPVLYDFRRRPALVQRVGQRMSVKRVFWQGEEVVMQGSQGWFRFKGGVLTKLQSATTIYH